MGLTDIERAARSGAGYPAYATVDRWCEMSGLGRRVTYTLMGDGRLRAVKCGRRTLIDVAHGLAYLAALPAARIKAPRATTTAEQPTAA